MGSLRSIARALKLGGDTAKVKRALVQNARTWITAKLTYRLATGEEEYLEAQFNRYNFVVRGSTLPNGKIAGLSKDDVILVPRELPEHEQAFLTREGAHKLKNLSISSSGIINLLVSMPV